MGLDKGDTIIKRGLAEKMDFLFEDVAALRDPAPQEQDRAHYFRRGSDSSAH